MIDLSVQLRVTSIRNRGPFGGAIFSGRDSAGHHFAVVCGRELIPDATILDKGQTWAVTGPSILREMRTSTGFTFSEQQIGAKSAILVRPAGHNLIAWIAESTETIGIGRVKAQQLYDRFGSDLIQMLEEKDVTTLAEIVGIRAAQSLCDAFQKQSFVACLGWLDQIGVPRRIGAKVLEYYKEETREKIETNPYALLSFEAKWEVVDDFSRTRLGIPEQDSRRLIAAVEEVLYRALSEGHTCLPAAQVGSRLTAFLGCHGLADLAIQTAATCTRIVEVNGCWQSAGCNVIERYIAERCHETLAGEDPQGKAGLFTSVTANVAEVATAIRQFEQSISIRLTPEQCDAVFTSLTSNLSLILGGAGTGKTTVLRALFAAVDTLLPGTPIFQVALAGLAAKRMAEATGRESQTIAAFLARIKPAEIGPGSIVVVDEASMVDAVLMYRLLRHLPPWTRLVLVGDPAQLPPIGPGLALHALADLASIPKTELIVVLRQSTESGIPQVAATIRDHLEPRWMHSIAGTETGVSFVRCEQSRMADTIEDLYKQLGGSGSDYSVQVLSITNGGMAGVRDLNLRFHNLFHASAEGIDLFDQEEGVSAATTLEGVPLTIGDLVMFTENDYKLGLRNGSLGRILQKLHAASPDDPCCIASFDGTTIELNSRHMCMLVHAYAISVHKAQGNEFDRVIVAVKHSRLLDQALLYTAVTRGIQQVVLVGDESLALGAISAPASSHRRFTKLSHFCAERFYSPQ